VVSNWGHRKLLKCGPEGCQGRPDAGPDVAETKVKPLAVLWQNCGRNESETIGSTMAETGPKTG